MSQAGRQGTVGGGGRRTPGGGCRWRRPPRSLIALLTLAVTVLVVLAVYNMGGEGDEVPPSDAAAPQVRELTPDEEQRVAGLIGTLDNNPEDVASLVTLGDIYYRAGDYATAGGWMAEAVEADPANARARLALGASMFNLGDTGGAERQWLRVVELNPGNVEAHYDLGFLYLSAKPPEFEKAKRMWRRVLQIAPGTAAAKTVASHLQGLERAGDAHAAAGVGGEGGPQ